MATVTEPVQTGQPAEAGRPRWLLGILAGVTAVALLVTGSALAVITGIGGTRFPGETSVDAGFARDMTTHHAQAVQMAQVVRDTGSDPAVRLVAYDIETQQLGQMGQMRGWLQTWGLTQQSDVPAMAWMSPASSHDHGGVVSGGPMPGMATTAELDKLRSLSGRALDLYFLQLMIRHHEGGIPMARDAATRASMPYVRDLASRMAQAQQVEVVSMEQMLRERGGQPLS